MKTALRKVFWPILSFFENGTEAYNYKPSYRKITIFVGVLFLVLACGALYLTTLIEGYGPFIPFIVFTAVSLVSLIVGSLGTERAISKIWGNK